MIFTTDSSENIKSFYNQEKSRIFSHLRTWSLKILVFFFFFFLQNWFVLFCENASWPQIPVYTTYLVTTAVWTHNTEKWGKGSKHGQKDCLKQTHTGMSWKKLCLFGVAIRRRRSRGNNRKSLCGIQTVSWWTPLLSKRKNHFSDETTSRKLTSLWMQKQLDHYHPVKEKMLLFLGQTAP